MLLHGLGTTRQIWNLVVPALAAGRRVITLDLPGFGASAPAGDGFDLEQVGLRVARALAARGVRAPFDLVGHSLGGAIALTLAARRPRLVRRLVLVAPAGLTAALPLPAGLREPVGELIGAGAALSFAVRRGLAPLTGRPWGRWALLALTADEPARLSPVQARLMVRASAGAQRIAPAMAAIAGADLRPLLTAAPAPLGLLWGERDRAVPVSVCDQIRARRPDAALELLARAGHVPMVERPEAFVAALERLLDGLSMNATT